MEENTENNTDKRDKRLANLCPPWKPGKEPTGGRPRGSVSPTAAIKRALKQERKDAKTGELRKIVDAWADGIIARSVKDAAMAKLILDRVDGVLTDKKELTGKDGSSLFPKRDMTIYTDAELAIMDEINERAESRRNQGGAGEA